MNKPRKGKSNGARMLTINELVHNAMTMRATLLKKMFDPRRNIEEECGYPRVDPGAAELRRMFDRHGLAQRVVDLYPEEAWQRDPSVQENQEVDLTDFERTFNAFQKKHNILHYLRRADVHSGIGHFGLILFGLNDGKKLHEPVQGFNEDGTVTEGNNLEVTFIRVFDESLIDIVAYETDPTNPRFGQPKFYNITFIDPRQTSSNSSAAQPSASEQLKVHWSRVVHLADNRGSSEVFGAPRQTVVWDRLIDARKIFGGNGEMYWRGAFPGISYETQSGLEDAELDISTTRDQLELYMNGLQRYLVGQGMTAKSLAPQIASPEPHIKVCIWGVTIPLKSPYRVFMGSEQASMASDQDISTWRGRMNLRNSDYTGPMVVKPVVQRLIDYGAVAPPDKPEEGMEEGSFECDFPDLNSPTDEQQINNASKMTEAIAKYVQSGANELIPEKEFLTMVLNFEDDEAESIIEHAQERIEEEEAAQAAFEERLGARIAADPSLRLAPPEGAERVPEEGGDDNNRRPTDNDSNHCPNC